MREHLLTQEISALEVHGGFQIHYLKAISLEFETGTNEMRHCSRGHSASMSF